ncbi:MAG: AMP-binding protein [Candidatus Binatia bacterium]
MVRKKTAGLPGWQPGGKMGTTKTPAVLPVTGAALVPAADTLVECFAQQARDRARVAFWLERVDELPRTVRWAELADSAAQAALRLRALGVERGDRVLLVLPTGADFVFLFWGVLLAGATPVPAYPPAGWRQLASFSDMLAGMAAMTDARLAVVPDALRDMLAASPHQELRNTSVIAPEQLWATAVSAAALPPAAAPGDFALIQFSSGSTGAPRGIRLTQTNLLSNIRAFADRMRVRREDALVTWLPLYHDMGLIGTMIAPLIVGMPLILIPPTDFLRQPGFWLRTMAQYRATISVAPQFAYSLCARKVDPHELAGVDLSPLRILLNGAEPIRPDAVAAFEERYRVLGLRRGVVTPCYGLAEGTLAVCMRPPGGRLFVKHLYGNGEGPASKADGMAYGGPVVSVGPPLAGTEVRIRAPRGGWHPEGRVGEICARGSSVSQTQLTHDGVAPTVDRDGWLHTGDLGFVSHGELFVTGRQKDLIIIGGRNLYPQEIEEEAGRLPGFRTGRVAAFGVLDPDRGTEVLVVTGETSGTPNSDPTVAVSHLRRQLLHRFGVAPYDIVLLGRGQLPVTTSGKLRRFEARAVYERNLFSDVSYRLRPVPVERLAEAGQR